MHCTVNDPVLIFDFLSRAFTLVAVVRLTMLQVTNFLFPHCVLVYQLMTFIVKASFLSLRLNDPVYVEYVVRLVLCR